MQSGGAIPEVRLVQTRAKFVATCAFSRPPRTLGKTATQASVAKNRMALVQSFRKARAHRRAVPEKKGSKVGISKAQLQDAQMADQSGGGLN